MTDSPAIEALRKIKEHHQDQYEYHEMNAASAEATGYPSAEKHHDRWSNYHKERLAAIDLVLPAQPLATPELPADDPKYYETPEGAGWSCEGQTTLYETPESSIAARASRAQPLATPPADGGEVEKLIERLLQSAAHKDTAGTCVKERTPECEAALALRSLAVALEPFAAAVYNDNGDLTVNLSVNSEDLIRAYFTLRRSQSSLK